MTSRLRLDRSRPGLSFSCARALWYAGVMALKSSALVPDTLDFCCGGKRCPKITDLGVDGLLIEDPDQSAQPIRLTREQAVAFAPWLALRLEQ